MPEESIWLKLKLGMVSATSGQENSAFLVHQGKKIQRARQSGGRHARLTLMLQMYLPVHATTVIPQVEKAWISGLNTQNMDAQKDTSSRVAEGGVRQS
jgi:hypothetical protein